MSKAECRNRLASTGEPAEPCGVPRSRCASEPSGICSGAASHRFTYRITQASLVLTSTALTIRSQGTLSKNFRMSRSITQSCRQQRSRHFPAACSEVSIHVPRRVMPELLCVTRLGCGSGGSGDRRDPGISGEGIADGGEDGGAVLCGGGGVAADRVPVAGGLFRAEPAADLLLGFRGPQVTFGLVGGGRDGGVGQEPQHVGFTAAPALPGR